MGAFTPIHEARLDLGLTAGVPRVSGIDPGEFIVERTDQFRVVVRRSDPLVL